MTDNKEKTLLRINFMLSARGKLTILLNNWTNKTLFPIFINSCHIDIYHVRKLTLRE